jgi:hypothetical protein
MKPTSNKLSRFGFIVAALFAYAAPASADQINCPVSNVRKEITTQLPNGWWNTPLVMNLRSTRIISVGGRNALQCRYGAAGDIQRYAPEGQNCTANSRGFSCVNPRPQTYSTKALNIPQTYLFDLDRGAVTPNGADLWFQAETADLLYLVPRNGAKIGVGSRANRGYDGCKTARMTTNRVSIRDVPVGSYVCMQTSEGRVSQFRVNDLSVGSPKTLSIGYITWR